jgi:aminomethyltransferase
MSMASGSAAVLTTPLSALHRRLGARMVPFAGYEMPVQYPAGILAEHLHTRTRASLFDVAHMGQLRLSGPDAARALEALVPADVVGLAPGRQCYSFFTNDAGGILDDLMIANLGDALVLVVNAARKQHDLAWLQTQIGARCRIESLDDRALLALQGPHAAQALAALAPQIGTLTFMSVTRARIDGAECVVSRSGYTGEDGFEISVPAAQAEAFAERLLALEGVAPAGLGARDSLRLEAGLCLYGHDIDESTSPVEARLAWALAQARREGGVRPGGYPGAEVIATQLREGAVRQRVGLRPDGRAPVREGETLLDANGVAAGKVTSGGFGATVNGPIAMAYVATRCTKQGTELQAIVRERPRACRVTALPFVPHRYFRGPPP